MFNAMKTKYNFEPLPHLIGTTSDGKLCIYSTKEDNTITYNINL
jgi:hypothetical protein